MASIFGAQSSEAAWHSGPNGRGTLNIIETSVITTGLCVWTAVHMNISEEEIGRKKNVILRLLEKSSLRVGWVLIGLLAPEMLAWNAWEQRQAAIRISSEASKAFGQRQPRALLRRLYSKLSRSDSKEIVDEEEACEKKNAAEQREPWTMTHGFYAAMGGFVVDTSDRSVAYLPGNRTRVALTEKGFLTILKHLPSAVPDIPEEEIKDKSKADGLAKAVVCVQAVWFCTQCLVRVSQGFAISLLELNVLGHCLCTLCIYVLWWEKPVNIRVPSVVQTSEEMHRLLALLVLCNRNPDGLPRSVSSRLELVIPRGPSWHDADHWERRFGMIDDISAWLSQVQPQAKTLKQDCCCAERELEKLCDSVDDCRCDGRIWSGVWYAYALADTDGTASRRLLARRRSRKDRPGTIASQDQPIPRETGVMTWQCKGPFLLNEADLERLKLASRVEESTRAEIKEDLSRSSSLALKDFVQDRVQNWAISFSPREFYHGQWDWGSSSVMGVAIASAAYGGLHLLAWNADFHSRIELTLWRMSALAIACLGLVLLAVRLLGLFLARRLQRYSSAFGVWINALYNGTSSWFLILYLAFFVMGRAYLLIECLMSLAYIQDSLLATPSWPLMFPHIA